MRLLLVWVGANILAGVVSVICGAITFVATTSTISLIVALFIGNYDGMKVLTIGILVAGSGIAGAVMGASIGFLQYLAIPPTLPERVRGGWIPTSMVGAATGTVVLLLMLLATGIYGALPMFTMAALGVGCGTGVYQGLLLRRVWAYGLWWGVVSGVGWLITALFVWHFSWIAILFSGLPAGIATGLLLYHRKDNLCAYQYMMN